MGRGNLTDKEVEILRNNPYVSDISGNRIIFTNEFKFLYMEQYLSGKSPSQIFKDAGFDTKILGSKRIERASQRWREAYASGSLGTYTYVDGRIKQRQAQDATKEKKECKKCMEIIRRLQRENEELKAENKQLREAVF